MKKYNEVEMLAKNAPAGSYAAGCPSQNRGNSTAPNYNCLNCERTM